jgi:hypothetical protein
MATRTYTSPESFKQALEQKLKDASGAGSNVTRKRQLLVFERFLARVSSVFGDAAILKGGLVLELRLERARTTRDVDLRVMGDSTKLLARLQEAARQAMGDFMTFEDRPNDEHPEIQNEGLQYEGARFRAECRLAGKLYGQPFGVDVVFGEPIFGEPEIVTADDTLAFAGIAPPTLHICPLVTHVAEKLHSYTMPRKRPNSRVKDLPDIPLLAMAGAVDANDLRAAFEQTFSFRKTHRLPASLPEPLAFWAKPYEAMAKEDELQWQTLRDITDAAAAFVNPVLHGELNAVWSPLTWTWQKRT